MKLTYITRMRVPDGAAQSVHVAQMSQAFAARLGKDFALICTPPSQSMAPSHPVNYFRKALRAMRCVLADRERVVITRDILIAYAVHMVRGRVIYELHSPPKGRAVRTLLPMLARDRRVGLIANCRAMAEHYCETFALAKDRIRVEHNAASAAPLASCSAESLVRLRAELDLPVGKRVLVHTGSLYKGGAELFGPIVAPFGAGALMVHIGGTEADVARWREFYARQGVQNLRLLPRVPHETALAYQRAADFLVYLNTRENPIHWCTSPLKIFEYMASGVPVIGSNLGSVGEVLTEQNAFCFDPDVPDSITAAAERARDDVPGGHDRAACARSMIEDHYSWDQRAARIIAFAEGLGR